jgi:hypothetical protein
MNKIFFTALVLILGASETIAATARPSVINAAAARMPTMTNRINTGVIANIIPGAEKPADACKHKKPEKLNAARCLTRYASCLKQESVCGSDFELCTDTSSKHKDFMAVKIMCQDILETCPADAINSLYKPATLVTELAPTSTFCEDEWVVTGYNFNQNLSALVPGADSRLAQMIEEGASLAALNAVSTCYKVAEQCFVRNCVKNPYACVVGTDKTVVGMYLQSDANGNPVKDEDGKDITAQCTIDDVLKGRDGCAGGYTDATGVRNFLKSQCFDSIGANKFCHITVNGKMPQQSDLADEFEKELIFSDIYNAKFAGANNMKQKLDEMIINAKRNARTACARTIEDCAMRSCGGGNGAACYIRSRDANGILDVRNENSLKDIENGCKGIVNGDANCLFTVAENDAAGGGTPTAALSDNDLFKKLFDTDKDTTGAAANLNSKLAAAYSPAGMNKMKITCQNTAEKCVQTMCGADYSMCYSGVQAMSMAGDTNEAEWVGTDSIGTFSKSMAIGLCIGSVRNSEACQAHFDAEIARRELSDEYSNGWSASTSVGMGWLGAQDVIANTEQCTSAAGIPDSIFEALKKSDSSTDSVIYNSALDAALAALGQEKSKDAQCVAMNVGIFDELIAGEAAKARGMFERKKNIERNECIAASSRGGSGDVTAWVKFKTGAAKIHTLDYAQYGLGGKSDGGIGDTMSTNDMAGGFCRVKVIAKSDSNDYAGGKILGTAYYAAGDSILCGSWLDIEKLPNPNDGKVTAGDRWKAAGFSALGLLGGGTVGLLSGNALQRANATPSGGCKVEGICVSGKKDKNQNEAKANNVTINDKTITVSSGSQFTKSECEAAVEQYKKSNDACKVDKGKNGLVDFGTEGIVGAAIGGLIGGVGGAAASMLSSENQRTHEREEWFKNARENISCYIGSQRVGKYNEVLSVEF